jgi:hypothetical protein
MATYRAPDGTLYPSKEWYDANVAKVNVPKGATVTTQPTLESIQAGIKEAQAKANEIASQISSAAITPTNLETGDSAFSMPGGAVSSPDISTAQSSTDYWKVYFENQQKMADEKKAEMETKTAEFETEKKSLKDKFTSLFGQTQEEKRSAEYEELGFDPTTYFAERKADIAEMESLYESYNAKVAERDNAVAGVEGVGMPQSWMDERKSVITNKYNAELNLMAAGINSKAAIMEAKQGNYNEARSLVDEAVSDYTADMKFQYSQFQEFMDLNQDFLDDLGEDYKNTLNAVDSAMLQKLTQAETEQTNVGNLMLQYPNAGIQIGDTLQEATQKASQWSATQPGETKAPEIIGSADTGYFQWNSSTGKWEPTGVGGGGTTETTNIEGFFNNEEIARLKSVGLNEDEYTSITKLIMAGIELDVIREKFRAEGIDPAILDLYDRAVGIEKVRSSMLTKIKETTTTQTEETEELENPWG